MALTAGPPLPAPLSVPRIRAWARENLFGSVGNTALTVITSLVVGFVLFGILRFVFASAEWEVVTANRKLFFIGRFPSEETWRLWVILFVFSGLGGLSWGLWSGVGRRLAAILAVGIVLVFLFMVKGDAALLTAGTVGVFLLGYAIGHGLLAPGRYQALARNLAVAGWLLGLVLATFLMRGGRQRPLGRPPADDDSIDRGDRRRLSPRCAAGHRPGQQLPGDPAVLCRLH